MAKTTMTFLFETGQVFSESWNLADQHAVAVPERLHRIAQARLPLLAASIRIVQLKAEGHGTQQVNLRGTGGPFAHPCEGVKYIINSWGLPIFHLRGAPREVFARGQLTQAGAVALARYGNALEACGAFVLRRDEADLVRHLHVTGKTLYGHEKDLRAPLRKLKLVLGEEEAKRFWKELKAQQPPARV